MWVDVVVASSWLWGRVNGIAWLVAGLCKLNGALAHLGGLSQVCPVRAFWTVNNYMYYIVWYSYNCVCDCSEGFITGKMYSKLSQVYRKRSQGFVFAIEIQFAC